MDHDDDKDTVLHIIPCKELRLHRPKRIMRQNYNKNILLNFI